MQCLTLICLVISAVFFNSQIYPGSGKEEFALKAGSSISILAFYTLLTVTVVEFMVTFFNQMIIHSMIVCAIATCQLLTHVQKLLLDIADFEDKDI